MWAAFVPDQSLTQRRRGFTIVELLIVIVVIGILAAITIVSFNGVQNRAKQAAAQTAVAQANKKIIAYAVQNSDQYPPDLATAGVVNGDTTFQYSYNNTASPRTYGVTATNGTASYYLSNTVTQPTIGGYAGHGVGGFPAITNLQTNTQLALDATQFSAQTPSGNTVSRSTSGGPEGQATYDVTTTAAGQIRIGFKSGIVTIPVQAGDQYNMSFYLNSTVASAAASIEVNFLSPSTYVSFPIGSISTGWNRYNAVVTVPAGMTSIWSAQLLGSGAIPSGATFRMTKIQTTQGPTLYNFADGSTAGWVWNGTPYNSSSTGSSQ